MRVTRLKRSPARSSLTPEDDENNSQSQPSLRRARNEIIGNLKQLVNFQTSEYKEARTLLFGLFDLERHTRFELVTSTLARLRSTS